MTAMQEKQTSIQPDTSFTGKHWVNLSHSERRLSNIAGGVLALMGLARGSLGGVAMAGLGGWLLYRGITGHCPMNAAMGRDTSDPASPQAYYDHGIHVEHTFTIQKSPEELYAYWRNFENLPTFMKHVKEVRKLDDKRSHWVVTGPGNIDVEWDAEIINDVPNELIAWRSTEGAQVDNSGSVRFLKAPGDRGTEVRVVIDYIPPGGVFGKWFASLFGEAPEQTIREDLRRFKRMMEVGTVPTTKGQPAGKCLK